MMNARIACAAVILTVLSPGIAAAQAAPPAPPAAGRITGIGGIFVASKDPKKLAAWYRDVLGIAVENWGGAMLRYDAPDHPPVAVWSAFREGSTYAAPSTRAFMIDFAVDDLDAFVARLQRNGVTVLKRDDSDPTGKFAWILDPDGTKIELWQPTAK
jgi:catechol 2,3-dioxygenase-like lactoylglutathione lyase family enzyme